jgi:hypothetical protein
MPPQGTDKLDYLFLLSANHPFCSGRCLAIEGGYEEDEKGDSLLALYGIGCNWKPKPTDLSGRG